MRILITGKNIEVSDYLRELVNKKVSKLERYFPNDTVAQVTMAVERSRHIVGGNDTLQRRNYTRRRGNGRYVRINR